MVATVLHCESFEEVAGWGPQAAADAERRARTWLHARITRISTPPGEEVHILTTEQAASAHPPYFGILTPGETPNKAEDGDLRVELVAGDWCTLQVTTRTHVAIMHATGLHDALGDLAAAVVALADGAVISTCLWGSEPGGFFLDFSQTPSAQFSLVVHEMMNENWIGSSREDPWTAERGLARFTATVDPETWRAALLRAFTEVQPHRLTDDDSSKNGRGGAHALDRVITSLRS